MKTLFLHRGIFSLFISFLAVTRSTADVATDNKKSVVNEVELVDSVPLMTAVMNNKLMRRKLKATKFPSTSKAPKAPSTSKAPKAPSTSKAPKAPSTSKAPKAPSTSKAPKAPSTSKAPKAPSTSKAPKAPSTSKAPKAPSTTKAPKASVFTRDCADSQSRFSLSKNTARKKGSRISRDCSWVKNNATKSRCKLKGVSAMCPEACDKCGECVDPPAFSQDTNEGIRFKFKKEGKNIFRGCDWVAAKDTASRCELTNYVCRSTCGAC